MQEEQVSHPPLGLSYLAASLRRGADGVGVRLVDCQVEGFSQGDLERELREFQPELVGISTMTHGLVDAVDVARTVRRSVPGAQVLLGGPHATDFPLEAVELDEIDLVIPGEADQVLPELARALALGRNPAEVPGVVTRSAAGLDSTAPEPAVVTDLNSLPLPDRSLLDVTRYRDVVGTGLPLGAVSAVRGCPFRCVFCNTPRGRLRTRDPDSIARELRDCRDRGIGEVYFVDDSFNADRAWVHDLCRSLLAADTGIVWTCRARADRVDSEMLRAMYSAGCRRVQYGVETSTKEGLALLNKALDLDLVAPAIAATRKAGIVSVAYFMLGCPGDRTRQDVEGTIDFAIDLDPDLALFNVLTPFPNTPLFDQGVEAGVVDPEPWADFLRSPDAGFVPAPWTEHLSAEELAELLERAYRRFYFRPKLMLRQLAGTRDLSTILRKARVGLGLLLSSIRGGQGS